jgi:hypothetical protein
MFREESIILKTRNEMSRTFFWYVYACNRVVLSSLLWSFILSLTLICCFFFVLLLLKLNLRGELNTVESIHSELYTQLQTYSLFTLIPSVLLKENFLFLLLFHINKCFTFFLQRNELSWSEETDLCLLVCLVERSGKMCGKKWRKRRTKIRDKLRFMMMTLLSCLELVSYTLLCLFVRFFFCCFQNFSMKSGHVLQFILENSFYCIIAENLSFIVFLLSLYFVC